MDSKDSAQKSSEQPLLKTATKKSCKPLIVPLIITSILAFVFLISTIIFLILFINANPTKNSLEKDLEEANKGTINIEDIYNNSNSELDMAEQMMKESCTAASGGQYARYCQCSAVYLRENGYLQGLFDGSVSIPDLQEITQYELLDACGDEIIID